MSNSSDEGFTACWFAREFEIDSRTVSKRIKAAEIKPVHKKGRGSYYRVVDVAPLLIKPGELDRASLHMEINQLTTSINRLSGVMSKAISTD